MDIRRKKVIKSSVLHSMERLLAEARKAHDGGNEDRSRRYVHMVIDLLRKHKAKLPKELKNSFCRKCGRLWIPGDTVTVTYDKKNACLRVRCACGNTKRI
jgi:RNase P subunit RPR2